MSCPKGTVNSAAAAAAAAAATTMMRLLVLLACLGAVSARSWDLAVTAGKEIDFISRNGNLTGTTIIANTSALVGLAYNDNTYTLYLSDAGNREYSIVSVDLTATNITAQPLLKRDQDSPIRSLAFDGQTSELFWATDKLIAKMRLPMNGPPGKPIVLHKLDTESPRAITLDVCNRYLYWANGNRSKPSIMRSRLDGSDPEIIVSENLYEPTCLAVDHWSSRLYWIDDEEGIHYKLEQSELDGSERSILVHGKHQEPVHLTVDRERLYWADYVYGAVWEIGKEPGPGDVPRRFRNYSESSRQADPASLLARDNIGTGVDCKAMKAESYKRTVLASQAKSSSVSQPRPTAQSFSNLTTSSEQQVVEEVCFNQGFFDKSRRSCRCKPGFSGTRCEISACHNYCLRGECRVNPKGQPICTCAGTNRSGARCEKDICDGFCLNNGECVVDGGKPSCECKYSSGARCEVTLEMAEICSLFCMKREFQVTGIDTSSCRCSELNQTIEEVLGYDTFNCTVLVPLLSGFVGMLAIAVILLSVYVSRLKRRPRIKKRFVVNKAGITPLTSRPSMAGDQQCEITIENCCNMNICETPCFEPKLRTSNSGGGGGGRKKEEKSNLLDHMEDGSGNGC